VIASDSRRAIESAQAVAPNREILTSSLVSELELTPPRVGRMRMPRLGWVIAYSAAWIARMVQRVAHHSPVEDERLNAAAQWIDELTSTHGMVAVVTHAWFRRQLIAKLIARGWEKESFAGGSRNWSAWSLTRRIAKVRE
jgi:hypothetical protein